MTPRTRTMDTGRMTGGMTMTMVTLIIGMVVAPVSDFPIIIRRIIHLPMPSILPTTIPGRSAVHGDIMDIPGIRIMGIQIMVILLTRIILPTRIILLTTHITSRRHIPFTA